MSWQVHVDVTRDGESHLYTTFARSPISFGARPDNDVVLGDPHVSGRHATVMVSRGALVVRDESRNGCFVGGERIAGQRRLGRRGVVHMPPFLVALSFEPDDDTAWQTAQHAAEDVRRAAEKKAADRELAPEEETSLDLAEHALIHAGVADAAPVVENGAAVLEVTAGPDALHGTRFVLPDAPAVELGRGEDATVRIADRTISRLHAVLVRQRGGRYRISDLDSANGVLVNGERVRFATLADGDAITLGHVTLVLRVSPSPAVGATAPAAGRDPLPELPADDPSSGDRLSGDRLSGDRLSGDGVDESGVEPPDSAARGPLDAVDLYVRPLTEISNAVLIDIRGPIDGYNDRQLERALERSLDEGARAIVVDLDGVSYLGHTAFGLLTAALEKLEQRDGRLLLTGAGQRVREAIVLSGLDERLAPHMVADREEALESLRG